MTVASAAVVAPVTVMLIVSRASAWVEVSVENPATRIDALGRVLNGSVYAGRCLHSSQPKLRKHWHQFRPLHREAQL